MNISEELKKIARHYGHESRCNLLIEECAEVIQAVSKYRRSLDRLNSFTGAKCLWESKREEALIALANLTEEIADVEIMLEQIKYLLDISEEDITAIKLFKVNRTKERIAEAEQALKGGTE